MHRIKYFGNISQLTTNILFNIISPPPLFIFALHYLPSDGSCRSVDDAPPASCVSFSRRVYIRQLLINIDIPTSEVVKCLLKVLQVDRMISLLRARANTNYLPSLLAVRWMDKKCLKRIGGDNSYVKFMVEIMNGFKL